ncbi:MAG: hypothetical protein KGJ07_00085 [Patescibacteria group bacterium]|nr:hypothetical protein [Patescibacteria group bacterium]
MSYVYGTGTDANYSGRVLVYPDIVPFDTDFLRSDQYRMVDVANLAQALIGLPSSFGGSFQGYASGICTQDSPNDMAVTIGVCTLYAQAPMEPIQYGNLGPLTTPVIFKQFTNMIALNSSTLGTITAPSSGNWQYYLIQGTPQITQINNVNRPYYNASNPASPNFQVAPDTEIDNIVFALVAGTPSSKSAGLPAVPAPTGSGIGMFLILVSDTTTSITNALISGYPGSFIGTTLTQMPSAIQQNKFNYAADTSASANTLTASLTPVPASYTSGMNFWVKAANTNTGASNVNLNGLGNKSIVVYPSSSGEEALVGGEIIANNFYNFEYDGTHLILLNPSPKMYGAGLLDSNTGNTYAPGTSQVTMANIDFDPYSITGSNSITPKRPGFYQVSAGLGLAIGASNGAIGLSIYKNAAFTRQLQAFNVTASSSIFVEGSCIVKANGSTDVFTLEMINSTSNNVTETNTNNYFQMVWLGD